MSFNKPLIFLFIFAFCLAGNGVYAFGAGNIPSFAYMEGKAFRHGDIEDALGTLGKRGGFALASLLGGSKWGGLDIKRVYFGNWLRDYSQAVDIAALKKLPLQTILNLCMVLGFMAHGYVTHEFEVTPERLGVYLPVEHIDNPKGYGEGEDPRTYDPRLRPPVDPREMEIDRRTGMKNYIANENGHWDTSKALVRRILERCIHLGRQNRARSNKQDEYEAYRLLGTALHTLEDFSAHSNFCELSLVSMGHNQVFTHVGDHVKVHAPNGKMVSPLITGTFGSSDFIHSLLGEATDHLSEASVSDLNARMASARSTSRGPGGQSPDTVLRELLFKLPSDGGELTRDMEGIQRIRDGAAQGGKRPEDMSPQELHAVLWQVLTFRDSIVKKIEKTIEKIPGLNYLVEKVTEAIAVFIFTTLEPFVRPILKTATTGLMSASSEVINNQDQYEVFNDPNASDPTHSFLSKDHFNLILNETAGNIAKIILVHTVTWVVKAWDSESVNVQECTESILQCLFHPDFHDPQSKVQREMLQYMRDWVNGLGHRQYEVLGRLSKESVRNHKNIRMGSDSQPPAAEGSYARIEGQNVSSAITSNITGAVNQIPGVQQVQGIYQQFQSVRPTREMDYPPTAGQNVYNSPGPTPSYAPTPPAVQIPYGSTGSFPQSQYGGVTSQQSPYGEQSPYGAPAPPQQIPYGAPAHQQAPYGAPQAAPQQSGYAPPYGAPPPSFVPPAGPPPGFPAPASGYAPPAGPPPPGYGQPGAPFPHPGQYSYDDGQGRW